MSTTQQFFASGAGNGFTTCLDRVDVTEYDYWITLGGFKKGDAGTPTAQQIEDSFRWAMKLFWQWRGVTGIAKTTNESGTSRVDNVALSGPKEPFERVCPFSLNGWEYVDLESGYAELYMGGDLTGGDLTEVTPIIRMYNGPTSDELNFVGYGFAVYNSTDERYVSEIARGGTLTMVGGGGGVAGVNAGSLIWQVFEGTAAYVSTLGPHLVCNAYASESWDIANVDPANLKVTASNTDPDVTAEIEITALDFYTFT